MKDEGVIKFNCHWSDQKHEVTVPKDLMSWRERMHELGLIGVYEADGIGYGNISVMSAQGMLISGTQTGHISGLQPFQYSLVTSYDMSLNSLHCTGLVKASAESLTHLAFYEADEDIQAIIHIHNKEMWQQLLHKVPTSDESVPYGTADMADEIKRLFLESDIQKLRIMTMGGHEEGLIAFGKNMEEAGQTILTYFEPS